jgi:glycerate-2-kinase
MKQEHIQNKDALARTKERENMIHILNAGFSSISTENAIRNLVRIDGETLHVDGHIFDLNKYKNIYCIAFGKASGDAVLTLESILGAKLHGGVALDKSEYPTQLVKLYRGTHPRPSEDNVKASGEIYKLAEGLGEEDLAFVVVSGGGSSLLCWPESECQQGLLLYEAFLKVGGTIREINTIRKHISSLKGGGLAKTLYPATVISLILCDVSGGYYEDVASGPTYYDTSTVADAEAVLKKYDMSLPLYLNETPKDKKYFEKVYNIPVLSNVIALDAMEKKSRELGYNTKILGAEMYDAPDQALSIFMSKAEDNTVLLAGGEPSLAVTKKGGSGGRNEMTTLMALKHITEKDTFSSCASDGIDNQSKYAGGIVDYTSLTKSREIGLDLEQALSDFDPEPFLEKTEDLVLTGETGSNVSDFLLMIRK